MKNCDENLPNSSTFSLIKILCHKTSEADEKFLRGAYLQLSNILKAEANDQDTVPLLNIAKSPIFHLVYNFKNSKFSTTLSANHASQPASLL